MRYYNDLQQFHIVLELGCGVTLSAK